jgi:hypothetical protein
MTQEDALSHELRLKLEIRKPKVELESASPKNRRVRRGSISPATAINLKAGQKLKLKTTLERK